jgi:hypothetical protein
MVTHAASLVNGQLQYLLCTGCKIQLAAPVLTWAGEAFNYFLNTVRFKPKFAQYTAGDAALFTDQPEKKVFGPDVIMAHAFSFLVSQA